MQSEANILANASLIKGFLAPLFYDEYGRFNALGPDDFQKVRDGYACAKCLCEYTTYLVRCPVCGHERDVMADLEDPHADHVNHLKDRARTVGQNIGDPNNFDDFMRQLNSNPDTRAISIDKLGPSKRRRK